MEKPIKHRKTIKNREVVKSNSNSTVEYNVYNRPIEIKLLDENAKSINYATPGSVGLDLRSNSLADIVLNPNMRLLIPTGIAVKLNDFTEGNIKPKSGRSYKEGLNVIEGTIDNDYRGEVKVQVHNISNKSIIIKHGDKIAQMVIRPVCIPAEIKVVDELDDTIRGTGGFGHTGIK